MINKLKKIYSFIRYNSNKRLIFRILMLSGLYRLCIMIVPMKILRKHWGIFNEESEDDEAAESYRQAFNVSHAVNSVCSRTPWDSKCLVRALTAQHILRSKKIASTLYLGVNKKDEDIIAHAWLRCGKHYITGGCGKGYTIVAKFRT